MGEIRKNIFDELSRERVGDGRQRLLRRRLWIGLQVGRDAESIRRVARFLLLGYGRGHYNQTDCEGKDATHRRVSGTKESSHRAEDMVTMIAELGQPHLSIDSMDRIE